MVLTRASPRKTFSSVKAMVLVWSCDEFLVLLAMLGVGKMKARNCQKCLVLQVMRQFSPT